MNFSVTLFVGLIWILIPLATAFWGSRILFAFVAGLYLSNALHLAYQSTSSPPLLIAVFSVLLLIGGAHINQLRQKH